MCGNAWSDNTNDHKRITQQNQQAKQPQPTPKLDTTSLEKTIRDSIKEAADKTDAHSEEKLESDRKIVEYTGELSFFTKILAIATVILTVIAIWQGIQLKKSVDSTERIERPYIFLEKINIERSKPLNEPNAWYISLRFKNVGRTPAIIHEYIANIKNLAELPEIPSYEEINRFEHVNTLAPRKGFWTRKFGPGIPTTPEGHDIRYIVYGRLVYEDTQGEPHETGFALEVGTHIPMAHQHNNRAYNYHT